MLLPTSSPSSPSLSLPFSPHFSSFLFKSPQSSSLLLPLPQSPPYSCPLIPSLPPRPSSPAPSSSACCNSFSEEFSTLAVVAMETDSHQHFLPAPSVLAGFVTGGWRARSCPVVIIADTMALPAQDMENMHRSGVLVERP